jgi:hypothetical protein
MQPIAQDPLSNPEVLNKLKEELKAQLRAEMEAEMKASLTEEEEKPKRKKKVVVEELAENDLDNPSNFITNDLNELPL